MAPTWLELLSEFCIPFISGGPAYRPWPVRSQVVLLLTVWSLFVAHCLQPQELQHARLPYPSPSPGACPNSCPPSQWYHPTISSSIIPFSSWFQSFPASVSWSKQNKLDSRVRSIPGPKLKNWMKAHQNFAKYGDAESIPGWQRLALSFLLPSVNHSRDSLLLKSDKGEENQQHTSGHKWIHLLPKSKFFYLTGRKLCYFIHFLRVHNSWDSKIIFGSIWDISLFSTRINVQCVSPETTISHFPDPDTIGNKITKDDSQDSLA